MHATDADGVDSLWLVVDSDRVGYEGGLLEDVDFPVTAIIPGGRFAGEAIPLTLEARDILGYVSTLDTFVRVAFPLRVAP